MQLENYLPKPHPLHSTFKKLQIPQIALANYLAERLGIHISQARVSQWLTRYYPIPKHIEEELQALADQVTARKG